MFIAWILSVGLAVMATRTSFKKNEAIFQLLYIVGALVLVCLAIYKYFYPQYCTVAGSDGNQKKKDTFYGDAAAEQQAMAQQRAAMEAQQTAMANKYSLLGPGGTQQKNPQGGGSKSPSSNDSSTPSNNSGLGYGICFCLLSLHFYFSLYMGIDKMLAMTIGS
jgi:hypothetical protein